MKPLAIRVMISGRQSRDSAAVRLRSQNKAYSEISRNLELTYDSQLKGDTRKRAFSTSVAIHDKLDAGLHAVATERVPTAASFANETHRLAQEGNH